MQILLNESKEIIAFATVGTLENGYQINDELLPFDFKDNFQPAKYKLENGKISFNDNFTITMEETQPQVPITSREEELWEMVAQLQLQNVQINQVDYETMQRVKELENRGVVSE